MNLLKKSIFPQAKEAAKANAGFSLIEILIALTLLGLAGTFVAGKIFDSL